MSNASLTSKRQLTLPKEVCERFGAKPGDRFACSVRGSDEIVLKRKAVRALDLVGVLPPPRRRLSLDELDRAARSAAAARFRRTLARPR